MMIVKDAKNMMIEEQEQKVQVAEGGKGITEDRTGTKPDGGSGCVSAKGGCDDYRGRGFGGGGDGGENRSPAAKEGKQGRGREECHSGSTGEAAKCVGVAEAHSIT